MIPEGKCSAESRLSTFGCRIFDVMLPHGQRSDRSGGDILFEIGKRNGHG